jgi:hypothetical protein
LIPRSARLALIAAALGCSATGTSGGGGAAGGGGATAGSLPLGSSTITAVDPSVCGPASAVPTSHCYQIGVTCPGIASLTALVKVSDPPGTATGTIVFGSGGGGGSLYEQFGAEAVNRVLVPLLAQGYRVVQRSWSGAGAGWLTGPGGTLRLACRYATLLERISTDIHTGGAFCITGNSGGSAEVSYAMAHYGMGRVVDLGVPTSGPPMGRIDYGCLGVAQVSGWATQCAALNVCGGTAACEYFVPPPGGPPGGGSAVIDGTYGGGTDCQTRNPAMAQTWLGDSVSSAAAQLSYPQTAMRFIYGASDCSEAVTLGRLYADAVTSDSAVVVVPGAPHAIPSDAAGAQAVFAALSSQCIARH